MAQPSFGLTVGTDEALERAKRFGVGFVDLHFGGKSEALPPALDACDAHGIGYVLNFEKAPPGMDGVR